jgi:amidase
MSTWIVREATPGAGLRVAVKDLIDVAGLPTTAGSRAVAERAAPAAADAACLAGLRAAAARGEAWLAGKTNLHELAYGISGVNRAFGTPVNPLDPARVPGGSSSGSAVAVASGEADVAYGSDTGGSIRIPAACCGVAGLKTTWGRIPLTGVWPLAPSLDTVGPMARDVAGLVAGMALLEPGFTVTAEAPRVVGRVVIGADPTVDDAVDSALAAAGWDVVPVVLDGLSAATTAAMTVLDAEAWASNRALAEAVPDQIGRDVLTRLREASQITPAAIAAAQEEAARWRATLSSLWDQVELLALPTLLGFPPVLGNAREMVRIRGLTSPVNLAGLPALALPVPAGGPLPASVQLIGPAGAEDRLLAAGAVLEQAVHDLAAGQGRPVELTGTGRRSLG